MTDALPEIVPVRTEGVLARPAWYAPNAWRCRCGIGISAGTVSGGGLVAAERAAFAPPDACELYPEGAPRAPAMVSNGACIRIGKEYSDGGAERVLARRRRMAVSVSVQFEAGGQPVSGAGGPITEPILPGFADLGQNSLYECGAREGVPRILDLSERSA